MSLRQCKLNDGRSLDYCVYTGSDNDFPLIFLHGTPGSYLGSPAMIEACRQRNLRFITISRPGWGGSDRNKGRRVTSTIADLDQFLKSLGIARCFVFGWSGGGPYAIASAALLDQCVAACSIAGVGPYGKEGLDFLAGQGEENVQEFEAAIKGDAALRAFVDKSRSELLSASPEEFLELWDSLLPPADKKFCTHEFIDEILLDFKEGMKKGTDGWFDDDMEMIQDWGFAFDQVKKPIAIWQGEEDQMVPFAHGVYLAKQIPSQYCKPHLLENEGHLSIVAKFDEMVDELLSLQLHNS